MSVTIAHRDLVGAATQKNPLPEASREHAPQKPRRTPQRRAQAARRGKSTAQCAARRGRASCGRRRPTQASARATHSLPPERPSPTRCRGSPPARLPFVCTVAIPCPTHTWCWGILGWLGEGKEWRGGEPRLFSVFLRARIQPSPSNTARKLRAARRLRACRSPRAAADGRHPSWRSHGARRCQAGAPHVGPRAPFLVTV